MHKSSKAETVKKIKNKKIVAQIRVEMIIPVQMLSVYSNLLFLIIFRAYPSWKQENLWLERVKREEMGERRAIFIMMNISCFTIN